MISKKFLLSGLMSSMILLSGTIFADEKVVVTEKEQDLILAIREKQDELNDLGKNINVFEEVGYFLQDLK